MADFNPVLNFTQGLQAGQGMMESQRQNQIRSLQQALSGQASMGNFNPATNPNFQRLAALDPDIAAKSLATFQTLDQNRQKAFFLDARQAKRMLEAGDVEGFKKLANDRLEMVSQLNGDPSDTLSVLDSVVKGDIPGAISQLSMAEQAGIDAGFLEDPRIMEAKLASVTGLSSEARTFNDMVKKAGLTPAEEKLARRIELGLAPRAVGSAAQTISQDQNLTNQVAASEAAIAGAKEGAKLAQEYKLKPKIAEAVGIAQGKVKLALDQEEEGRSDAKALRVFDAAMTSLNEALGGTTTGPVAGLLPAMTANAQMADGAVAMIAPTLKQIFRTAGEGNFTDADQKLLMDMVPTRTDSPEARMFKMNAINTIVRQKLTSTGETSNQASADNPFSGFKVVR